MPPGGADMPFFSMSAVSPKRGLVDSPDKWQWSSFRFYYLQDASVLAMDRSL